MDTKLKNLINNTDFEKLFNKLGYTFFKNGDYNLNIIGIRNLLKDNKQDNTFNDAIVVIYKKNNIWIKSIFEITTDPGITYLKSPINNKGCGILVPGQYKSVFQIDLHQGKYPALCQRGNLKVYRDNNKDDILDFDSKTIEEGSNFGVNIHKAGKDSQIINNWSAACQVFKKEAEFNEFMKLCYKSKDLYGNKFTYTLITTSNITNSKI